MKRILIIEDDLEISSMLHDLFVDEGYDVITYPDKNSIKGVIINRPDLVLLDNKLNDGFGHELCTEIKGNEMTKHIPVILTSGYDDLEELAKQCGADAFLAKPFDLAPLLSLVKQLIEVKVH
jgi:DNA-binding response OmpR family regulator